VPHVQYRGLPTL